MELNPIRLALLRRLVLAQSWHWSVYQQISATTEGFLEWYEAIRAPGIHPTDTGTAE